MREIDAFVVGHAQEPWLLDVDGRTYINANGSWWVSSLGHDHPRLVAALRRQTEVLLHCSLRELSDRYDAARTCVLSATRATCAPR